MSTIIEQIEQQIAKLSNKAIRKNTGVIRTIADGVAKIDGLSEVMYNEMVQFPGGVIGIALNLETDEVGCVVLGDVSQLKEGDPVETANFSPSLSGKLSSVASLTPSAIPSTAKAPSLPPEPIPWSASPPASSSANQFPSRSSPASWPSIP